MIQTFNKILAAIVVLVMLCAALVMGGCQSGPTPGKELSDQLNSIKKVDFEQILKDPSAAAGIDVSQLLNIDADTIANMTDNQKATISAIMKKLMDFDFKVNSEKVDGDAATVNVTFTTYDFGSAIKTALQNALAQAMSIMLSGGSQSDVESLTYTAIQTAVDELSTKSVSTTVDIPMKRVDGKWQIGGLSNEVLDAMFGGLLSSTKSL